MSELTGALAYAQISKLSDINEAMRRAKWKIRRELEKLPGLGLRRIMDPAGDTGAFLIHWFNSPELCGKFIEAVKAEGIRGEGYGKPCIAMTEWGLHWYFNNKSLVHRKSLHENGWPWTLPHNDFARAYTYGRGTLPRCDDYESRSALLKIPSCLTDEDINDIIEAYQKVASCYL
jgi:8-amino-3,8-dideoxy-alpha-D-manno-octulosonate transaminase